MVLGARMAAATPKFRRSYPSDLTDEQWALIEHLVPEPIFLPNLQEPVHQAREMMNAIRYRTRTGTAWRSLPHDFPPWSTVMKRYLHWRDNGVFERVHDALRTMVRVAEGRNAEPTAGLLDSQSVKSTDVGGPRGFDAGKKVKGRKRHLLVDILGLLLVAIITPADVQDRDGGAAALREAHREFPTLEHVWVDGAYNGQVIDQAAKDTGIRVEMVKRSDDVKGFKVLPKRWIVERTNGWLGKFRILSKEYERTLASSRADVIIAMGMLMLRRLTTPPEARKERR